MEDEGRGTYVIAPRPLKLATRLEVRFLTIVGMASMIGVL